MNKKLVEIANSYFKIYPERSHLYVTEDGNVFIDKSPAKDHAVKTKQKWFVADNPKMLLKIEEKSKKVKAAEAKAKSEATVAELKAIKSFDQLEYSRAVEIASVLNLNLKDKKKETVFSALIKEQKELLKA